MTGVLVSAVIGVGMARRLLFIQGAGDGSYREDAVLVARLRLALGEGYDVVYPAMSDDGDASYSVWKRWLEDELANTQGQTMVVGHSVGASVVLKFLTEQPTPPRIDAAFLLAAPFWGGDGWRYDGYEELELPPDAHKRLPAGMPVFLYHCNDDDIVPSEHLALYGRLLREATCCELDSGGHQFDDDISPIATAIKDHVPSLSNDRDPETGT